MATARVEKTKQRQTTKKTTKNLMITTAGTSGKNADRKTTIFLRDLIPYILCYETFSLCIWWERFGRGIFLDSGLRFRHLKI